jgi:hypothetical protein
MVCAGASSHAAETHVHLRLQAVHAVRRDEQEKFWLRSAAELSVAIDNTETPFGRLPWAEQRCPYVSDHKCCLQPLDVRTMMLSKPAMLSG